MEIRNKERERERETDYLLSLEECYIERGAKIVGKVKDESLKRISVFEISLCPVHL